MLTASRKTKAVFPSTTLAGWHPVHFNVVPSTHRYREVGTSSYRKTGQTIVCVYLQDMCCLSFSFWCPDTTNLQSSYTHRTLRAGGRQGFQITVSSEREPSEGESSEDCIRGLVITVSCESENGRVSMRGNISTTGTLHEREGTFFNPLCTVLPGFCIVPPAFSAWCVGSGHMCPCVLE